MITSVLRAYVAVLATYECALSCIYVWMPPGPSIMWDPGLPINWVFAIVLNKVPQPLSVVLLACCLWHFVSALILFRNPARLLVFAIGEVLLSLPGLIVYGPAVVGDAGHGFGGLLVVEGLLTYALANLAPIMGACRLLSRGGTKSA
jgi:hypothetical protein